MPTRCGEIFTIAVSGDYGKPRPALVIQADAFDELPSVTVLRITSELIDAPLIRIPVAPDAQNGLRKPSKIMVDKAVTVPASGSAPEWSDRYPHLTDGRSFPECLFGLEGSTAKR